MTPFDYWCDYIRRNGKFSPNIKAWIIIKDNNERLLILESFSNSNEERIIFLNMFYHDTKLKDEGMAFNENDINFQFQEKLDLMSKAFKSKVLALNPRQ